MLVRPRLYPLFEGQDVYCLLVDDDPLQLALTGGTLEAESRAGGRLYESA